MKQQLRKKRLPIPINDVWLAAATMEYGAALQTLDGHFDEIDGLRVIPEISRKP